MKWGIKMKYEVKIKSGLVAIASALSKKNFKAISELQDEMSDNLKTNKEYCNDFFTIYEKVKGAPNKQFFNIMEELIIKSGMHTQEELSNKCM
jgi:mRNA-degrading endonuclease RelE of RelBE toxin-antitoxin system